MRLERSALELFAANGYAETTVPQITERAGLTTRTFFRHFTDKREVLFLREREFPQVVTALLAGAPSGLKLWPLVMHGFETVASSDFDTWREGMKIRRAIIRSDGRLHERELLKSSTLAAAIETALVDLGHDRAASSLLAQTGSTLFQSALDSWLDDDTAPPLVGVLRQKRADLEALLH